jgi:pimeloyl-ACP methyl ester carboxylesterase
MTRRPVSSRGLLVGAIGSALLAFSALAVPVSAAPGPAALAVTKKPCPANIAQGWKCITLTLPADHFHDSGMTTKVTFALKRHTGSGPAKGVWVTITGGPGSAGIYSAVEYTDTFAPSVRRDYDLVFMDQRGSGQSGGFTCPNAALDYYTDQSESDSGIKQAAHAFVEDCLDESNVDHDMLPYYGTKQAVEDLEAFRLWLGVSKMSLYGESYGTQYVQSYAAAHPDHVEGLFIDGPVDLETTGPDYYVEGTTAFEQVLQATMFDCTTESLCSRDVHGGNEMTAYDELAARLENGPIHYTFTFADGQQEQRAFTATDLENAAAGALNNLTRRRMLQRAMAAASHGDVWRLARLAYDGVAQDPDSLEPVLDPSWSDALYYAVECMDYRYFPNAGTPNQRAQAFIDFGRAAGVFDKHMSADYLTDLPCVYWPTQPGPNPRPSPSGDAPYPLIVMGATIDPATPFGNAQRIVERRGDNPYGTWLIYIPGGPHVIFGRYESCPDDQVTNILVNNKYPKKHTIACPGGVAADYVRTPDADQIRDNGRKTLLVAYDGELNYGVDYWYWDYSYDLKFGCAFGGTIEYTPTAKGSAVELDECSFVEGSSATGSGRINDFTGAFRLDATFHGEWHGTASYRRSGDGSVTLTGTLRR